MVNEIQIKWLELRNLGTTHLTLGYSQMSVLLKNLLPNSNKTSVGVYKHVCISLRIFLIFFITDDPGCIIIINEVNVMYHLYTMVAAI